MKLFKVKYWQCPLWSHVTNVLLKFDWQSQSFNIQICVVKCNNPWFYCYGRRECINTTNIMDTVSSISQTKSPLFYTSLPENPSTDSLFFLYAFTFSFLSFLQTTNSGIVNFLDQTSWYCLTWNYFLKSSSKLKTLLLRKHTQSIRY